MKPVPFYQSVIVVFTIFIAFAACSTEDVPAPPDPPTKTFNGGIGVMGDSTSDEYRADDARGGDYAETTLSWVEQLVESRDLDFGEWGTWESPRRTGYAYNWARTGATARTLLSSGQHTGLAKQVAEGKVDVVVLWIGGNDFHLKNGPYEEIYNGTLSGAALRSKLDKLVADITTAADTVLAAGDVKMGIVLITDQGMAKSAPAMYPDPAKRQRVSDAIAYANQRLIKVAEERGVITIDSNALADDLFARMDGEGYIDVGGEKISVLEAGDEPHHLQLGDSIGHSGTVLSGIIANKVFIEPFNEAYDLQIRPLTDAEILQNAGIRQRVTSY